MMIHDRPGSGKENKADKSSGPGSAFIVEFKEFISFLQNLWGVLAGISVLFPLSNAFMQIIPLGTFENGGALVWFSPHLFTTFATLVSLFLIFWTFGQRQNFRSSRERPAILKKALISFGVGLSAFVSYLAAYYFIAISSYNVLGWESEDIRRLLGEIPLLFLYGSFFALVTRSFVLLGLMEFFRREKKVAELSFWIGGDSSYE